MSTHQRTINTHRKYNTAGTKKGARRRGRRAATLTVAASLFLLLLAGVLAAPADLDTSFDTDGKLTTDFGNGSDQAHAVAVQPDGKIVTSGSTTNGVGEDFALIRYNTNGSLDTSFDGDGKVTTSFGSDSDVSFAVALQPDGKIVAAGYATIGSSLDFAVARYNTDGSLDTSFDNDGKVTTDFGISHDVAFAVAVQPDGKIVAAGFAATGANEDFAVVRYNTDGSLDTTFDNDGKVTTNFSNGDDRALAVALQPDGKIVAAGANFAVARYNTNGSLDTSFDTDGKVTTPFGVNANAAYAVALQPDGKIVAAGYAFVGSTADFAIVRYNTNGSLDTSFDGDGKVTTSFGSGADAAQAVALQPDGKIVAPGSATIGSSVDFAVARYNTNGSLDTSFDGDGKVTTSFSSTNTDQAQAVAVQPDGKIVAAGLTSTVSNFDFAVARYIGDPKPNETSNFDTDRQTDIAIWNTANGNWYIQDSTTNITRIVPNWGDGALGDVAVPGDYDGDGKTDTAVFRPSEGNWYIIKSSDNTVLLKNWGNSTDTPTPGDYDLDGKTDTAVFRPSEGNWYILNSRDNTVTLKGWGTSGDKPVPGDYDGDGATDIAVYRPSEGNWYIVTSRDRFARVIGWGNPADKPVPADYDGDGRVDVAVYRNGVWYIRLWTNTVTVKSWGDATDTPVPADYDGDGRADIAVWRSSDLNWYIIQSATGTGRLANIPERGVPVASAYLPQ